MTALPDGVPDVSVVIPTVDRTTLTRAVESARAQLGVLVEVLVVVDLPEDGTGLGAVEELCDEILWTGGGRGAGHARNLGVRRARGRWVAHLDDDDCWHPDKLSTQLRAGEPLLEAGRPVLVSSRVLLRTVGSAEGFRVPAQTYRADRSVAEYLFAGRGPAPDRPAIFSSTLLVDRASARLCEWDDTLRRHQDWDWVLRFSRLDGAVVRQLPEVLGEQVVGSEGSVSASRDWQTSLAWGQRFRDDWTPDVYADFVAGQVLRFALAARSPHGVLLVVRELLSSGRPSLPSLALGVSGLVPRRLLTRLAFLFRRPGASRGALRIGRPMVPQAGQAG